MTTTKAKYLGTELEIYIIGFHPDVIWPTDADKNPLVCPLGYVAMVWPPEKKGKPRKVYFHWPTQLEEM